MKEPSNEATIVKDFLYHQGRSKIRDQLETYIKDLKEGTNIKVIKKYFQKLIILFIYFYFIQIIIQKKLEISMSYNVYI